MDTVALVLGIYGALLSTALGVYQCLRDRRRLLVTSGTLITVDAEDELLMVGLCADAGLMRVGVVAVDGTKVHANASERATRDYE